MLTIGSRVRFETTPDNRIFAWGHIETINGDGAMVRFWATGQSFPVALTLLILC